ncbi:hypothetical protein EJB05_38069, partial [Eragrostis curvula]
MRYEGLVRYPIEQLLSHETRNSICRFVINGYCGDVDIYGAGYGDASLRVSLVGELDRASNPVEERQCYSQQQLCRCRLEDMVAWRGADALLRI